MRHNRTSLPSKVLHHNHLVQVGVVELWGQVDHGDDRFLADQRLRIEKPRFDFGEDLIIDNFT